MSISTLQINNVRNLQSVSLTAGSRFNVIFGENGSGKTSMLEAIYLLGHGRSFRSYSPSPIIHRDHNKLTIFAHIHLANDQLMPLGLERGRNEPIRIRLANQEVNSIAEIAKLLPMQLISSDSYQILEAGPKYRRKFLDWGLFHVEHTFFSYWKTLQKILQQRNAALKKYNSKREAQLWDRQLVEISNKIDNMRELYFKALKPLIKTVFIDLIPTFEFKLEYHAGWDKSKELTTILNESIDRDFKLGYTQNGPHRGDIQIKVGSYSAESVLSRGQQKILVNALQLAQGMLLHQLTNKQCIYLIDDLTAELDGTKLCYITNILNKIDAQVFITTIEPTNLVQLFPIEQTKRFHVEHGAVTLV